MTQTVLARVAALETTPTADLKTMWRDLFQAEPPGFNRAYLISRLAYRIQELEYGGLSDATRARLEALAQNPDLIDREAARKRIPTRPVTGTRLIREWKGVQHHVTVTPDGYEYQGQPFKSLSAVARSITGTRWNGPAFFGLRDPGAAK